MHQRFRWRVQIVMGWDSDCTSDCDGNEVPRRGAADLVLSSQWPQFVHAPAALAGSPGPRALPLGASAAVACAAVLHEGRRSFRTAMRCPYMDSP